MKTPYQVASFLQNYTPKSPSDRDYFDWLVKTKFQIGSKTLRNAPRIDAKPLEVHLLTLWLESGLEAFSVAYFENRPVLLGNVTLDEAQIVASLTYDGTGKPLIDRTPLSVPYNYLTRASTDDTLIFQLALLSNGLEPDLKKFSLRPKYTPKPFDRVIFYDFTGEHQGVGVVREILEGGEIEFFCYNLYNRAYREYGGELGYSMHEKPGVFLHTHVLENIEKENTPTFFGNSTSSVQRLRNELAKVDKAWKDRLSRIEPLNPKAKEGEKYWYINERLSVVTATEKGLPKSHKLYLAGNYFTDFDAALKMSDRLRNVLYDYLALTSWPKIDETGE